MWRERLERFLYLAGSIIALALTGLAFAVIVLGGTARADTPPPVLTISLVLDKAWIDAVGTETAFTHAHDTLDETTAIYADQVGVQLRVVDTTISHVSDDTQPLFLLSALEAERAADPTQCASGLTIFFTNRDLAIGDIHYAGWGSGGPLCSYYAAAIVKVDMQTDDDPIIAAHEIAHVFGVVHDGVGVCANEQATGYIMQAIGVGGSRFSPCSLRQFATAIAETPCLTPTTPSVQSPLPVKNSGPFDGTSLLVLAVFTLYMWAKGKMQ